MSDSFLDITLSEVPEITAVEEGEYEVQIVGTPEVKQSQKTGGNYISIRLEVVGYPTAKDINQVLMLASEQKTDKENFASLNRLRDFCNAFGIDTTQSGLDLNTFAGQTGFATLTVEETAEYGTQNRVKKFHPRS